MRRGRELAGLAIGIAAGLGIALAWLVPARGHSPGPAAAASSDRPFGISGLAGEAALDAEWVAYSDHSTCADWAGRDGVSAIRLTSSQLAWFFSDTSIGPAGPTIGFSQLSGFAHNSLVIQTTTGPGRTFVTMTGGGACAGAGGPGNAAPVVGPPPAVPGGPSDRYWAEDGLEAGGTVIKFYNHYRAGIEPYVPLGTVIAAFPVSQLSAGRPRTPVRRGGPARAGPAAVVDPAGRRLTGLVGGGVGARGKHRLHLRHAEPGRVRPGPLLYLARVPVSQLTEFSAWRFYAGAGHWAAVQGEARPVQPPGRALDMSSGFSVVAAAHRYWLIQNGPLVGTADIDAYPASAPWGPFDYAAGRLLYRDPSIGLDAADEYRIMYEARAEPALSTGSTLVISYNVNSEAATTGCAPMSNFTNTSILPRFVAVPLAAFGACGGPWFGDWSGAWSGAWLGPERAAGLPADRAAGPVAMVRRVEVPG